MQTADLVLLSLFMRDNEKCDISISESIVELQKVLKSPSSAVKYLHIFTTLFITNTRHKDALQMVCANVRDLRLSTYYENLHSIHILTFN